MKIPTNLSRACSRPRGGMFRWFGLRVSQGVYIISTFKTNIMTAYHQTSPNFQGYIYNFTYIRTHTHTHGYIYIYVYIYMYMYMHMYVYIQMLNFTRSWGFGIFTVYWVSKSKCIISSNLRAEGSWGKVLNVVIFVESVVHRSNWRSRGTETVGNSRKPSETVGNSRKQSGAARRDRAKIVNPPFFCKKKRSAQSPFFLKVQRETVGNSWGSYLWLGKKRAI